METLTTVLHTYRLFRLNTKRVFATMFFFVFVIYISHKGGQNIYDETLSTICFQKCCFLYTLNFMPFSTKLYSTLEYFCIDQINIRVCNHKEKQLCVTLDVPVLKSSLIKRPTVVAILTCIM